MFAKRLSTTARIITRTNVKFIQGRPFIARMNSTDQAHEGQKSGTPKGLFLLAGLAGAATYFIFSDERAKAAFGITRRPADYVRVYNQIADKLDAEDYDDGSYGPVLLRLAWHASGTYDSNTKSGGSDGATMRFSPEKDHAANGGLAAARDFLEPIKKNNPWISYSDLWILAGICAVQEMGGPQIPFRPGRADKDFKFTAPDGRLPDASQGSSHIRDIFYRMGFNDQEIVALMGAHALGRCHTDRSGYSGPWTFSPTYLGNDFYKLLLSEKWQWKKWQGPKQYEDKKTKSLMMLPTDMEMLLDKEFRKYTEQYAKDEDKFRKDFSNVVSKLFELGCERLKDPITFTPTNA